MEEQTTVDTTLVNLVYINIQEAIYLMEVMNHAVKNLCLDQEFTPELKKLLKKDYDFTSKSIQLLTSAQKAYKDMMRNLDILEVELNKKVKTGALYDQSMANMLDLLSVNLVYMMVTDGDRESEAKIHEHLKTYEWPEELQKTYQTIRDNIKKFKRK